jgi:hypothetical protein
MRRNIVTASLACLSCVAASLFGQESLPTGETSVLKVATADVANLPANAELINNSIVSQWLSLDAQGGLNGSLGGLYAAGAWVARPGVNVALGYNGRLIAESISDEDGKFRLTNFRPGTYAFIAASDQSFAAFAVHVYPSGSELPSSFQVTATKMPLGLAAEIARGFWAPGLSAQDYYRVLPNDPLSGNRQSSTASRVRLVDGNLTGRVSKPGWSFNEQDLTGNVANVVFGGAVVATAPVTRDGYFTIKNLSPGIYDILVAGDDGVAAIGFEAVGPQPLASQEPSKVRFVSQPVVADSLNIELIHHGDAFLFTSELVMGEPILDPAFGAPAFGGGFPGGGVGGGMGGGGAGGGVGGLGGLGGLLGIGGLAAGIAALSNDDSFNANLATDL